MTKFFQQLLFIVAVFTSASTFSQNNFFTDAGANRLVASRGARYIIPEQFRTSQLNVPAIKNFLWALPKESTARNNPGQMPIVVLPMPDGSSARFRVWESSIMEPGLEAKFPDIKTFAGQGIDDRYATIRFDIGPNGFHAQVLSVNGIFYIDPYAMGDTDNYISYFRADYSLRAAFPCGVIDQPSPGRTENTQAACLGTNLRSFRVAVAADGEYTQFYGGTVANAMAGIVTTMNRVDGIYEQELAIRLVLVANNNLIIYTNAATDPYNNTDPNALLTQNQSNLDAIIGTANYDIGHVFTTAGGGLAGLGVVCRAASKAQGETGTSAPIGDAYDVDYVAHEMGHQFGGNHTFNSNISSCNGNRASSAAYEVGSGTTIQAYAGICGADNIQPNSDPYFHSISFDEISNYVSTGAGICAVQTPTGNVLPIIAPFPANVTIPAGTPFTLTGTATDANGDALTYSWEEFDRGVTTTWNGGNANSSSPLFKFRVPKTTGSRTFPDISLIAANYTLTGNDANGLVMNGNKGEILPSTARTMSFRLTVRDNRAGGGGVVSRGGSGCQSSTPYTVTVIAGTPFQVTIPNGGESYSAQSTQTITWNTAATNAVPFNVSNVNILLSTDGGLTYPTTILANTPNDGSESVMIPNVSPTTTARVKIEAIGNIFFDISNANFGISVSVLPVVLTDFKGTLIDNKNSLLEWSTSSENNSKQFELEKSYDGINYRKIATVPAAGFSNSPKQYNYTDREPMTEKNYYRLKTVDLDNRFKTSNIVLLKVVDAKQGLIVLENPFRNNIQLRLIQAPAGAIHLSLMDMSGRLVAQQRSTSNSQDITFKMPANLSNGAYMLQLKIGTETLTTKLIKE